MRLRLEDFTEIFLPKVEEIIKRYLSGKPELLYRASYHLISAGGKRLRPLILGLFSLSYDGDLDIASYPAASIEILHNFTLVHDDIMDNDDFRRGVPTTHRVYGIPMAILAGDLLHSMAYRPILELKKRGLDSDIVTRILDILNRTTITLAEGQALDTIYSSSLNIDEENYIEMISKKTASLFSSSAVIGGLISGAPETDLRNIELFSINAGIAFQIRDDIIGVFGDPKETGKPILNDLREGKRTLLVIKTIKSLDDHGRKVFTSIVGDRNASIDDLYRARDIIRESGALRYAEERVKYYYNKAIEYLEKLQVKNNTGINLIKELASKLAWRRY